MRHQVVEVTVAQVQEDLEGRKAQEVEDREEVKDCKDEEVEVRNRMRELRTRHARTTRTRRQPVIRRRIGGDRDCLTTMGTGDTGVAPPIGLLGDFVSIANGGTV